MSQVCWLPTNWCDLCEASTWPYAGALNLYGLQILSTWFKRRCSKLVLDIQGLRANSSLIFSQLQSGKMTSCDCQGISTTKMALYHTTRTTIACPFADGCDPWDIHETRFVPAQEPRIASSKYSPFWTADLKWHPDLRNLQELNILAHAVQSVVADPVCSVQQCAKPPHHWHCVITSSVTSILDSLEIALSF